MAATGTSSTPGPELPTAARVALVPLVALLLLGGAVVIVGQLLPGGNDVKIVLAIAFFVAAGAVLGRLAKGRPDLRLPLRAGVLLAALALGGWYLNSLRGKEVQEELVDVSPPAAERGAAPAAGEGAAARDRSAAGDTDRSAAGGTDRSAAGGTAGPQLVASGSFAALDHAGSGSAEIVRDDGELSLQLRDFATDAGPDLRVYLASDTDASEFVDLGALKGNSGNQAYEIPDGTNVAELGQVLIWCRAFSVGFTAAAVG